ncbi:hypothetical protein H6F74_18665 [Trichocoleus sp. FACHB-90]|uniref:hypothetical protein n=1 Tax=Cyanophyceae TaxID=3028117 RepID=UPI00168975FF|nr:hypothetical protein [Trichocoleus sp. FACHB-90]MBD1928255.1 hypothetical protein [Trichocoleus sp. FACHB-90]
MSVLFGNFPAINGTIINVYLAVFTSVILTEVPGAIAIAQPQVDETTPPNEPENPLFDEQKGAKDQISSVSQLYDLQPAD